MEIKVGKRYWNRAGGITAPIKVKDGYVKSVSEQEDSPRSIQPYSDGPFTFSEDGSFYGDGSPSMADLVDEYTGPELVKPIIVEVGKRYVNDEGWVTPPVVRVEPGGMYKVSPGGTWCSKKFLIREFLGKDDPICNE